MKKVLQVIFVLAVSASQIFADWGFFGSDRSWIGIDFNGNPTAYRLYNNGTVSGPGYFNGSALGTFTSNSQTLAVSFWDIKTYKNGGSDVQQAKLFYRIYENTNPSGGYIEITGGWLEDLIGAGDQKWGKGTSTSIDISSLSAGKTYVLELYIEVYGTQPDEWKSDNNSGSNFKATFTTDTAFPVELLTFSAITNNDRISLTWQTATEVNNYGFEVERAFISDAVSAKINWKKIGFVPGYGSSNSVKEYSFIDENIGTGKYSYRLKQIDNDGQFEYSKSVEVTVDAVPGNFALYQNYPNPFNPVTTIKYSVPEAANVSIKVYNVIGMQVAELVNELKVPGNYLVRFDASSLESGVYLYRINAGDFTSTRKMALIK